MRRLFGASALAAILAISFASRVHAQDAPPSPERIKAAAEEFDRGRRAYLAKDFEQAALHFENAYRDAPRAETLRLAMRARRDGRQLARAATLAAIALELYADDPATTQMSKEILEAGAPQLQELFVDCSVECAVAADGRVVSQSDAVHHRIFLDPGTHDLGISFSHGRSTSRRLEAKKGASDRLSFEPPPLPTTPAPSSNGPTPTTSPATAPPHERPLGPVVFFVGVGLTLAAGGATIWSGLDTQSSPGVDAVRRACAGKDASCPAYQEGQDKELRTNVLLGATIGLTVITGVIGLFFTQWGARREIRTGIALVPGGLSGRF